MTDPTHSSLPAKRILAADDSNQDSLLLKEAFEVCGIAVDFEFVNDGNQLRERLSAGVVGVNLILLDHNLPSWPAVEFLASASSQQQLCAAPVVVLSSFVSAEDEIRLLELGARAVFTKPMDLEGFVRLAKDLDSICADPVIA